MFDVDCFIFVEDGGLIEFLVDLGDVVEQGQFVVWIFLVICIGFVLVIVSVGCVGLMLVWYFFGIVKFGDCVVVIGVEVEE